MHETEASTVQREETTVPYTDSFTKIDANIAPCEQSLFAVFEGFL